MMIRVLLLGLLALLPLFAGQALTVRGRCFYLDGRPFPLRMLLEHYGKPVVDDEPGRNGTPQFGGPGEQTYPSDHILQIFEDWKIGAYPTYHHDMFQMGAGASSVPPNNRYAPRACGE